MFIIIGVSFMSISFLGFSVSVWIEHDGRAKLGKYGYFS